MNSSLLGVLILGYLTFGNSNGAPPPSTYRAAVLQHQVIYRSSGPETMWSNLKVYESMAHQAAQQGAQLMVFPEYGITGFINGSGRRKYLSFAQDIPDPKHHRWNPCLEPRLHRGNTTVLRELSCIARNNSLALVANLISRVPCTSSRRCPRDDGQFMFNTNVIISSSGTILATYHKRHLFDEDDLDPSPQVELTVVDLGFVKLGTFICFDILFGDPAIQLIRDSGVRNIAFPTAWVDELPFLTSVQTFAGFAHGLGVNLLAANIYKPEEGLMGSGIYSSLGVVNETYDLQQGEKLLIADVPTEPEKVTPLTDDPKICKTRHFTKNPASAETFINKPSLRPDKANHQMWLQDMSSSVMKPLTKDSGLSVACRGEVCCSLDYEFGPERNGSVSAYYALSAFNDMHGSGSTRYYVQACAVVLCRNGNVSSCGITVPEVDGEVRSLKRFTLSGRFSTQYLFPNVFSVDLENVPTYHWLFRKERCSKPPCVGNSAKLKLTKPSPKDVLVSRILGRDFASDDPPLYCYRDFDYSLFLNWLSGL